jgi:ADP-ribose pyrophosphatase
MADSSSIEKTLSSTTVYSGRVVRFRVDRVVLPGGKLHTREVCEHRGAVALIPLLDNRLILIRQYRLPAGKVLYELPAGTLLVGEKPEICAGRELAEETGYRARTMIKLLQCYLAPGYSTELMHFYLATDLDPGEQQLDEDEVIQVCSTSLQRALEMIRSNEIEDAKTIIGILLLERYLTSTKQVINSS